MTHFTVESFDEQNIDKRVILRLINQHIAYAERLHKLHEYYRGNQAIQERTRTKGAPNNKITINLAAYISNIATGYFISNPITYTASTDVDIDPLLIAFDKAHTDDTDADNAFDTSVYGSAYEYIYAAENAAEVRCKSLTPTNTFLVCDTSIEERPLFGVYYRIIHDAAKNRKRYVATVCTKHYIYTLNILDGQRIAQPIDEAPQEHYFGDVPIIEYQNNHESTGDFEIALPLLDAYNIVMSDRVNDVQDYVDAILVIYGSLLSDDSESGEAKKSLRDGKLLEFPDKQTMGAEWLTRQLDQNGVEILQKAIAKDIMRMAGVPDFSDENFASNSSGVAIAYKTLLLEWLTKTKERYYRQGLRKRIKLFSNYLGFKQIMVDADSIIPHFSRSLPVNKLETAQTVAMLGEPKISARTLLTMIPGIEDPDAEIAAYDKELAEKAEMQRKLFDIRPNTPPDDEDEETGDVE